MPKIKINVKDYSGVDAAEGFKNYDGPTPPKGVYRCRTGYFAIVENRSGDQMFKIVFEVAEPKKTADGSKNPKAKYNGYAIWHNANITEQGAPYLNAMLDALGINRKAVWSGASGGIVTDPEKDTRVVKIGGAKVRGVEVIVTTSLREHPAGSGVFSLNASSFTRSENTASRDEADEDEDESSVEVDDDDDEDDEPAKPKKAKKGKKSKVEVDEDKDDDDEGDAF